MPIDTYFVIKKKQLLKPEKTLKTLIFLANPSRKTKSLIQTILRIYTSFYKQTDPKGMLILVFYQLNKKKLNEYFRNFILRVV